MLAVLDPCLVMPHRGQDADLAFGSIERLADLLADVTDGRLSLLRSASLFDLLSDLGLYPLRASFDEMLNSLPGGHAYSGADIAGIALRLLQRSHEMESIVADFEISSCESNIATILTPACDCHPEIDAATHTAVHQAAAWTAIDRTAEPDFLASHRGARPDPLDESLAFRAIMLADGSVLSSIAVRTEYPVAASREDALALADPIRILRRARKDPREAVSAVEAALCQYVPDGVGSEWSLQPSFVDDITSPGLLAQAPLVVKALRACAEIVTGLRQDASHALREGAGPSQPQICRSGARAWRQDVDREWHIHFWRFGGGRVQLASLRGHNYFEIPGPCVE